MHVFIVFFGFCLICIVVHFYLMLFVLLYLDIFFFFFKQKTAYEMRISDWSSDVCSSDLEGTSGPMDDVTSIFDRYEEVRHRLPQVGLSAGTTEIASQIGRASCRERVCQYV